MLLPMTEGPEDELPVLGSLNLMPGKRGIMAKCKFHLPNRAFHLLGRFFVSLRKAKQFYLGGVAEANFTLSSLYFVKKIYLLY